MQYDLTGFLIKQNEFYQVDEQKIRSKFINILQIFRRENADVVCFPELSMSNALLQQAKKTLPDAIIIGGSFYNSDGKNVCPIVIDDSIYYTEKKNLSPYEIGLTKGPLSGSKEIFVNNSKIGSIGVLICADFLDPELRYEVLSYEPDLLFIVSLNSKSDEFFSVIDASIVDCSRNKGYCPIFIYCNSLLKHNDTLLGDGKSSLWGFVDKLLLQKLRDSKYKPNSPYQNELIEIVNEKILIVEIDVEKLKKGPGPHIIKDENFEISKVKIIPLED